MTPVLQKFAVLQYLPPAHNSEAWRGHSPGRAQYQHIDSNDASRACILLLRCPGAWRNCVAGSRAPERCEREHLEHAGAPVAGVLLGVQQLAKLGHCGHPQFQLRATVLVRFAAGQLLLRVVQPPAQPRE